MDYPPLFEPCLFHNYSFLCFTCSNTKLECSGFTWALQALCTAYTSRSRLWMEHVTQRIWSTTSIGTWLFSYDIATTYEIITYLVLPASIVSKVEVHGLVFHHPKFESYATLSHLPSLIPTGDSSWTFLCSIKFFCCVSYWEASQQGNLSHPCKSLWH